MNPFYGCGSTVSRLQSHYKEIVYFLPVSSQKFLVLIWSTSEEWKGELSQPWSHPVVLNTGPLDWESSTLTGSITLSTKWIHNLLRSLDWIKQKGTTAKREMNPALYDKLVFTKRKKIFEHKIPSNLILNFDQTPLGFVSPSKTMYTKKNFQELPLRIQMILELLLWILWVSSCLCN